MSLTPSFCERPQMFHATTEIVCCGSGICTLSVALGPECLLVPEAKFEPLGSSEFRDETQLGTLVLDEGIESVHILPAWFV